MPDSFSAGTDNLFEYLGRYGGSRVYVFPPEAPRDGREFRNRIGPRDGEPVRDWFVRTVEDIIEDRPERCGIETDMGVFARVECTDDGTLLNASIQAVVSTARLDALCLGEAIAWYYRMDLDRTTLAPFGTHPYPHVHISTDERAPRIAVECGADGNIIVDFIEFLYRHHYSDTWGDWARRVHLQSCAEEHREAGAEWFEGMANALVNGRLDTLRGISGPLQQLKRVLATEKRRFLPHRLSFDDRRLLQYPD